MMLYNCPITNTFLSTVKKESSLFTQYHFQKKRVLITQQPICKKKKTLLHSVCHHSDGHACFQPVTYLKQLSGDITLTSSSILKGTS